MNKIKSQILEICEEVTFKRGLTDKLYGCAEMFGEDCIVLYEGINFIRYTSPTECQEKCDFYFPGEARKLTELGYDHCIGHLKMPDDSFRLVYDKDAIIEHLKSEDQKLKWVQWLLNNGANPNAENLDGSTPLVSAAQENHFTVEFQPLRDSH